MSTAASASCCCPSHCPSLIATRRPWPQRLREAVAEAAGSLLAAARSEPENIQALEPRLLCDIGWCREARPERRQPELW